MRSSHTLSSPLHIRVSRLENSLLLETCWQTLAGRQKGAFHSRAAAKAATCGTAPADAIAPIPKSPVSLPSRSYTVIHAAHLCFVPVTSNRARRQARQPEAAPGMPKPFFKGWGHNYQLHSSGTEDDLSSNLSHTISNSVISYMLHSCFHNI